MRWIVAGIVMLALASPSSAQLMVYDGFDYTVGERIIDQVNPGTSGAWFDPTNATGTVIGSPNQPGPHNDPPTEDPQVITEGSVSYTGLPAATGNSLLIPRAPQSNIARIRIPLNPGAGSHNGVANDAGYVGADGIFFSFTTKLTNSIREIGGAATESKLGGFFAGFHSGPFSSGTQGAMTGAGSYAVQVRIRDEVVEGVYTGKYQFGLVKNNVGQNIGGEPNPDFFVDWDTSQSFGIGDEVFLVGNYQFNGPGYLAGGDTQLDDIAQLWINPVPGENETTPEPTIVSLAGQDVILANFQTIRTFWFRSDTAYPGDFLVDELRIGQSYADVTPGAPPAGNGDFNGDGIVDAADYVIWRKNPEGGNLYSDWVTNFGTNVGGGGAGAVPEPSTLLCGVLAAAFGLASRRKR